jgi:hypothetical protein
MPAAVQQRTRLRHDGARDGQQALVARDALEPLPRPLCAPVATTTTTINTFAFACEEARDARRALRDEGRAVEHESRVAERHKIKLNRRAANLLEPATARLLLQAVLRCETL